MITKELLEQANSDIKTIPVKGKEYVMVNERIRKFREICPNGSIITDIVECDKDHVIIKAKVLDDELRVVAIAHAEEKANAGFINKTSYVENCETSAVGRALGFLGIGIDDSMGSADEVANAILNQRQDTNDMQIDSVQAKTLMDFANEVGVSEEEICKQYKVASITAMNNEQYGKCMRKLKATKEAKGE